MLTTRDILYIQSYNRLKVKGWKNCVNRNKKRAGVTVLISGEIDFKTKLLVETKRQL